MELFSLFRKKIKLHSMKYHLIDKIDQAGLNSLYLKELRTLLKEEQKVNKQLKKEVKKLSKFVDLSLVSEQLNNIGNTTKKQLDILKRIRLKIFKQSNYQSFKEACRTEVEQSKFFLKILDETATDIKGMEIPEEEFKEGKLLVKQAQKTYIELIKAVGNVKKVQQKATELILINRKIKRTKLYEFIKYDVDFVTEKARYALKNPKESKLKFILAGAYIVSPGTFELTGIYLFFRYLTKYIKHKTSRVYSKGAGTSPADDRPIPN